MTVDVWIAIGSVATAAAVIVAVVALLYQRHENWRARRLGNIWRLSEYWNSDAMRRRRALAAYEIKQHRRSSDMTEVLNFFDDVAFLDDEDWVTTGDIWGLFFTWMVPYWFAAKYAIDLDRKHEPSLWGDCDKLIAELIRYENDDRRRRQGKSVRTVYGT